jgi:serine/threonine protein kinase
MIESRVLHGDLSPNNFIVHKGIGYFIDFDHASILAEGKTSTYSHGTVSIGILSSYSPLISFFQGTMPYISLRILFAMMKLDGASIHPPDQNIHPNDENYTEPNQGGADRGLIEHRPSDDLESMFYIFLEIVAKYGGPGGQVAPTWTKLKFPWASAYEALGKEGTIFALNITYFSKSGALIRPNILADNASEYFAELRPLVRDWGAMVSDANKVSDATELTHAAVLGLLEKFTKAMQEELPFQLASPALPTLPAGPSEPLAGPSEPLAGPSEPPAGPSESLPRRSARLSTSLAPHPHASTPAPSEPHKKKKSKRKAPKRR